MSADYQGITGRGSARITLGFTRRGSLPGSRDADRRAAQEATLLDYIHGIIIPNRPESVRRLMKKLGSDRDEGVDAGPPRMGEERGAAWHPGSRT
jgi:hypothetical protein